MVTLFNFQTSKDDFELLKEKGQKAKNLLMKVFTRSTSSSDTAKVPTSKPDPLAAKPKPDMDQPEPKPFPGNETILESEHNLNFWFPGFEHRNLELNIIRMSTKIEVYINCVLFAQ